MIQEQFATESHGTRHWPTEIRLASDRRQLSVAFDDGSTFTYAAEYLRVESPSAEVQGHSPRQKQLVPGKRQVSIQTLEPVGNYAVRIVFDDGHDTGLYSWTYLYRLGREHEAIWSGYVQALAAAGLGREAGT